MVTQGFPDWSRNFNLAATLLASETVDFAAESPQTFGPFYVGNFPMIRLSMGPLSTIGGAEPVQLDVIWGNTSEAPVGNDTFTYNADQGKPIVDSIAVMSPFVSFRVSDLDVAPSNSWELVAWGVTTNDPSLRPADSKTLLSSIGILDPNETVTLYTDFVTTGPAQALLTMDSDAWTITVTGIANGAAVMLLYKAAGPAPGVVEPFALNLPPMTLEIVATDASGAGSGLDIAILLP